MATRKDKHLSEKTTVIFRKWPDGSIIALFPEDIADMEGNCTAYMHIGQHGAADYSSVIERTKPVHTKEFMELKKELETRGYNMNVMQKWIRKKCKR
jgi:hypothetical protein